MGFDTFCRFINLNTISVFFFFEANRIINGCEMLNEILHFVAYL